jgi:hypothetical protein
VRRGEPQHLDIYVPHAGPEVQSVASIFVGVSDHLSFALSSRNFRAGDELVGSPHGPGLLRRIKGQLPAEQNDE